MTPELWGRAFSHPVLKILRHFGITCRGVLCCGPGSGTRASRDEPSLLLHASTWRRLASITPQPSSGSRIWGPPGRPGSVSFVKANAPILI